MADLPVNVSTGYFTSGYVSALDDSEQPFALWVPRSYSPHRSYPLIVALHGSDADHRMIPEQCFRIHERGFREDMLFLSPFGRGDLGFDGPGEADLWDLLQWVRARYHLDSRRVYLTGLSMGGFACWRLACRYPRQWAAIAPICGGGSLAGLRALKTVPVWCVHGDRDEWVPVSESRRLIAELRRLKYRCRYDELPGWKHNSWEWLYQLNAHRRSSLAEWFLQFQRHRAPPPILTPQRTGTFADLFAERLLISIPAHTKEPQGAAILAQEAKVLAQFSTNDSIMRSGQFPVRLDADLTRKEVSSTNLLVLGRPENHAWLRKTGIRPASTTGRDALGLRLHAALSRSVVSITLQANPWNKDRLLGIVTYQNLRSLVGVGDLLLRSRANLAGSTLYDATRKTLLPASAQRL